MNEKRFIYKLVPRTRFDRNYVRYEITKNSGRKCFCHLQMGIMNLKNEYKKYSKNIRNC